MAKVIFGLESVIKGLRETPKETRAVVRDVVSTTTRIVTQRVDQAAPFETGALRDAVVEQLPKGRGLTGYVAVLPGVFRGRQPSAYVLAVEYGKNGRPFIRPTAEREAGPYVSRMQAAGKTIERNLESIGARNL